MSKNESIPHRSKWNGAASCWVPSRGILGPIVMPSSSEMELVLARGLSGTCTVITALWPAGGAAARGVDIFLLCRKKQTSPDPLVNSSLALPKCQILAPNASLDVLQSVNTGHYHGGFHQIALALR